eukprot:scaffold296914_cov33-Tisochrysis_lutea.AAC.7
MPPSLNGLNGHTPLCILRYLNFVGCPARLFNAGSRRRNVGLAGTGADFFSAKNVDAAAQREEIAMETLEGVWSSPAPTKWVA